MRWFPAPTGTHDPWGWAAPEGATLQDAAPFGPPGGLSCALGSQRPLCLRRGTSVLKGGGGLHHSGAHVLAASPTLLSTSSVTARATDPHGPTSHDRIQ